MCLSPLLLKFPKIYCLRLLILEINKECEGKKTYLKFIYNFKVLHHEFVNLHESFCPYLTEKRIFRFGEL